MNANEYLDVLKSFVAYKRNEKTIEEVIAKLYLSSEEDLQRIINIIETPRLVARELEQVDLPPSAVYWLQNRPNRPTLSFEHRGEIQIDRSIERER